MRLNSRTQVWTTQVGLIGIVLLVATVILSLCVCTEAPFEPNGDDPPVKDYRAWFRKGSSDDHRLFSYHTATGEVDSVTIPWQLSGNPAVSHNGSLIYVPSGEVVKVLETDSFTTVGEIPHQADEQVVMSPDGEYVAVFGDSLWIVRTSDYATVFVDTIRVHTGCFSYDSKTLYTAHGKVSRISLHDPEQISSELIIERYFVSQVEPTPDESKLLIYFGVSSFTDGFGIYDIALESLLNWDLQIPGVGDFAMTPDGKLAFYGNPGNGTYLGNSELTVYDVETNRMVKRWNMNGTIPEYEPIGTLIGEMVISPDGRWLLAHLGPINQSQVVIQWDIHNERLENYYLGLGKGARGISIQIVE